MCLQGTSVSLNVQFLSLHDGKLSSVPKFTCGLQFHKITLKWRSDLKFALVHL